MIIFLFILLKILLLYVRMLIMAHYISLFLRLSDGPRSSDNVGSSGPGIEKTSDCELPALCQHQTRPVVVVHVRQ